MGVYRRGAELLNRLILVLLDGSVYTYYNKIHYLGHLLRCLLRDTWEETRQLGGNHRDHRRENRIQKNPAQGAPRARA